MTSQASRSAHLSRSVIEDQSRASDKVVSTKLLTSRADSRQDDEHDYGEPGVELVPRTQGGLVKLFGVVLNAPVIPAAVQPAEKDGLSLAGISGAAPSHYQEDSLRLPLGSSSGGTDDRTVPQPLPLQQSSSLGSAVHGASQPPPARDTGLTAPAATYKPRAVFGRRRMQQANPLITAESVALDWALFLESSAAQRSKTREAQFFILTERESITSSPLYRPRAYIVVDNPGFNPENWQESIKSRRKYLIYKEGFGPSRAHK